MRMWSPALRANLAAFRGHLYPVWDVAACPRGLYAATASADRTARLWSTEHPRALRIFTGRGCSHATPENSCTALFGCEGLSESLAGTAAL